MYKRQPHSRARADRPRSPRASTRRPRRAPSSAHNRVRADHPRSPRAGIRHPHRALSNTHSRARADRPHSPRASIRRPRRAVSYTHLDVYKRQVSSSAVVSRYLEAEYVEARKLTVSKHQISELRVEEFTYLPEKKRGVIGALLSGFFRRLWLSVRHRTPINAPYKQSSPNAKEESGMKGRCV